MPTKALGISLTESINAQYEMKSVKNPNFPRTYRSGLVWSLANVVVERTPDERQDSETR